MWLPTRRWLLGAAALAAVAPLGFVWPAAGVALAGLDLLWIAAWLLDALRAPRPASFRVRREAPPAFSAGRSFPVRYAWSHDAPRTVTVLVREVLPPPFGDPLTRRLQLPPRAPFHERLDLRPDTRGVGDGGTLFVRVRGPLGLAWRQGRLELPWRATVFTDLRELSLGPLAVQSTRRREAGLRHVRRPGEGRLFETLREWVPGDDTRIIDWKATARRGKPIARQYEDERRQQVLIVIDAGRMLTAEVDGESRLEAVVRAALHLAHAAVAHDDNVGLMVFADEILQFFPPSRGRRALRAVAEALAGVEGRIVEPDYPAAFRYLAARNRKRALTVLFTDVIDRTASEALVGLTATLRPRHLPLAVTLRQPALEAVATGRPATVTAAYERAAAEALLAARDDALAAMRAQGVIVLDVPPARAAEAVVARYDQLKRRGMV